MINNVLEYILAFFRMIRIQDILDIIIVAYGIYSLTRFVRSTRAASLVKGILILLITFQLSEWLNLYMVNYILKNAINFGVIAMLIVFQPELRSALERMGRTKFKRVFNLDDDGPEFEQTVQYICDAAGTLSSTKTGALMVIERHTKLSDIVKNGVQLNSDVTSELLINLFVPKTPLHDGAVIIREGKILAAACVLPLTQNTNLNTELGTRHRAALGMSEVSDAMVVVVSEETGKISLAMDGTLTRNLNTEALKKTLIKVFSPEEESQIKKIIPWKGVK